MFTVTLKYSVSLMITHCVVLSAANGDIEVSSALMFTVTLQCSVLFMFTVTVQCSVLLLFAVSLLFSVLFMVTATMILTAALQW